MKKEKFEQKVKNLLLISRRALEKFEPEKGNLEGNLKYWQKIGNLVLLKNGLYILKERYEKEPKKDLYLEYIANQMVQPSYLSCEYVMAKYGLLSEPVYSLTSVTTKKTTVIQNKLGAFRYYLASLPLFTGYFVKYIYGAPVWEARKEKAIFDFFYFKFIKNQPINNKAIDDLRLNWIQISRKEWKRVESYGKLCRSRKVKEAMSLAGSMYFKN